VMLQSTLDWQASPISFPQATSPRENRPARRTRQAVPAQTRTWRAGQGRFETLRSVGARFPWAPFAFSHRCDASGSSRCVDVFERADTNTKALYDARIRLTQASCEDAGRPAKPWGRLPDGSASVVCSWVWLLCLVHA